MPGGVGLVTGVRMKSSFWFISNYYDIRGNQVNRSPPKTCFLQKHEDSSVWVSRTSTNGTQFRKFFSWKCEFLGTKVSITSYTPHMRVTMLYHHISSAWFKLYIVRRIYGKDTAKEFNEFTQWKKGNYYMVQRKMKSSDPKWNSIFLAINLPIKCVLWKTPRGSLLRSWEEKKKSLIVMAL